MSNQVFDDADQVRKVGTAVVQLGRIDVARTKTSKEADQLHKEIVQKFKPLMKKISDEYNTTDISIQDLQAKYDAQVKPLIRRYVSKSYELGTAYVGRALKKEDQIYLSSKDMANIRKITDEVDAFFWRQIDLDKKKKQAQDDLDLLHKKYNEQIGGINSAFAESIPEDYETVFRKTNPFLKHYDIFVGLDLMANDIVTPSIALATVTKTQVFIPTLATSRFSESDLALLDPTDTYFIFVTRKDERVCPDCNQVVIDGNVFPVWSAFIIYPPLHKRCRCRLLIKVGDKIYSM